MIVDSQYSLRYLQNSYHLLSNFKVSRWYRSVSNQFHLIWSDRTFMVQNQNLKKIISEVQGFFFATTLLSNWDFSSNARKAFKFNMKIAASAERLQKLWETSVINISHLTAVQYISISEENLIIKWWPRTFSRY